MLVQIVSIAMDSDRDFPRISGGGKHQLLISGRRTLLLYQYQFLYNGYSKPGVSIDPRLALPLRETWINRGADKSAVWPYNKGFTLIRLKGSAEKPCFLSERSKDLGPLGPLGFERAQHMRTPRPALHRIRRKQP